MAVETEVIARLPFAPKKGVPYTCHTSDGRVLILDNGRVVFNTKVAVDPLSWYEVEGRKVIRKWDAAVAAREEALAESRRARDLRTRSATFAKQIGALAKRLGGKAKRVELEALAGAFPVWEIATGQAFDLSSLQRECARNGIIVLRGLRRSPALLAFAGEDDFDACDLLRNIGNVSLEPAQVRAWFVALRKATPTRILGASYDQLEFMIERTPTNAEALAKRLVRQLRPDELDLAHAMQMLQERTGTLWWD